MSYIPILFNTEMVQAIQAGQKTQTRRIIKDNSVCRPFNPGDILWVRETWAPFCLRKDTANNAVWCHSDFCYKASPDCMDEMGLGCKWHPSIHMPKEAARIFLRVKDVRVERLLDMGYSDLANEGFGGWDRFISLWNSTIKSADRDKYGWNANPWVWVIEFERCEKPQGFM